MAEAPTIQSVRDVPDDQGKQVRIVWYPSVHDRDGDSLRIVEYGIWRRVRTNDSLWDFVTLEWTPRPDPDVAGYWIYRSNVPNFPPTESHRIGSSVFNRFDDMNVQGPSRWYYRIAAFDSSGNEGRFSEEVAVNLGATSEQPTELALYQNFPNPFNPSTTIRFDVPFPSHVSIRVYDLLGREVAVLVNRLLPAGRHEVMWDGQASSCGIYVYRMMAGVFVASKKLLLLK